MSTTVEIIRGQLFIGKLKTRSDDTTSFVRENFAAASLRYSMINKKTNQLYLSFHKTQYLTKLFKKTESLWASQQQFTRSNQRYEELQKEDPNWEHITLEVKNKAPPNDTISDVSVSTGLPSIPPSERQGLSDEILVKVILANIQVDSLVEFFHSVNDLTNKYLTLSLYEKLKDIEKDLEKWHKGTPISDHQAIYDFLKTLYSYSLSEESLLFAEWRSRNEGSPLKETKTNRDDSTILPPSKKIKKTVKPISEEKTVKPISKEITVKPISEEIKPISEEKTVKPISNETTVKPISEECNKTSLSTQLPDIVVSHFDKVIQLAEEKNKAYEDVNEELVRGSNKKDIKMTKGALRGYFRKSFNEYLLQRCNSETLRL